MRKHFVTQKVLIVTGMIVITFFVMNHSSFRPKQEQAVQWNSASNNLVQYTDDTPSYINTLGISAWDQYRWNKVAWCETHGDWDMHGSNFSGGLGISNVVWIEYGGQEFAPHAGLATPFEQMLVAKRINSNGFVPDQNGTCHKW